MRVGLLTAFGAASWAALVLSASQAFALDLSSNFQCRAVGHVWQVFKTANNRRIGPLKGGFASQADCQTALQKGGLHSVCSTNGYVFQPVSIDTGLGVGAPGYGLNDLESCEAATSQDLGGVVCNWNGTGYAPYYSGSGHAVGGGDFAFDTADNCESNTSAAIFEVACNWNGTDYTAYDKKTGRAVKSFKTADDCSDFASAPSALNPSTYQWNLTNGQAQSCTYTDVSYLKPITETLSLDDCAKRLPMKYKISDDGKSCAELTPEGAPFSTPPLATCIAHEKNVQTYRVKGGNTCVYVLSDGRAIGVQDASVCAAAVDFYDTATKQVQLSGPAHWTGRGNECGEFLPDPKTGALTYSHKVDNANCMQPSQTFFQWLDATSNTCVGYSACGMSVGSVDVKNCAGKTNRWAEKWPSLGYTWGSCISESGTVTTVPFDKKGGFVPQCAPDTLYAWHAWDRISDTMDAHDLTNLFTFGHGRVFSWRTPIGSFGYGNVQMRLKLKPTVKFKLIPIDDRDCPALAKKYDISNTVFVDTDSSVGNGDYSEYVVCSGEALESWSVDLPQAAAEMIREVAWIKGHANDPKRVDFDSLAGTDIESSIPWNIAQDWDSTGGHTNDWSAATLKAHIKSAQDAASKGQAFFDKAVVPSLWNHFSTLHPGYFNPYDATKPEGAPELWPERDAQACLPH